MTADRAYALLLEQGSVPWELIKDIDSLWEALNNYGDARRLSLKPSILARRAAEVVERATEVARWGELDPAEHLGGTS